MKTKKLLMTLPAVGLGLTILSGPASAITWYSPVTVFQDDNLDYVFDRDGSGTLTVGDRLFSVFEFTNTQGILPGQGPTGFSANNEVTGVADIAIIAIDSLGRLIFAPTNSALTAPLGLGVGAGSLGGFAGGTAVAAYIDPTADLNVINATCGTRAACTTLAGLGLADGSALLLTAGFFGDADASWVSTPAAGGTSIATVQGGSASASFGDFTLALSVGVNNTGLNLGLQSCAPFCGPGGDGLIQMIGNGNILGGQALDATQWTARSDTDVQLAPSIPEPASLAFFGIALAGLGAMRRRVAK